MATLNDIKSVDWQLSTVGVGAVAQGVQDVRQCIDTILRTTPGTDPLRPQFGSNIYQYVSKPVNVAVPGVVKAIIDALDLWENRVELQKVSHYLDTTEGKSQLKFTITYRLVDDDLIDAVTYTLGGSTVVSDATGTIIFDTIIPDGSGKIFVFFTGNGNPVYPYYPLSGFDTKAQMLSWIQANWFAYGKWYLTGNRLILYLQSNIFDTASLSARVISNYSYSADIPAKEADEYYTVNLLVNGLIPSPAFPAETAYTAGDILTWVNNNWSAYGSWSIVDNKLVMINETGGTILLEVNKNGVGGFSLGFSQGFNV
ncbi:MAG: GPW/gp25 family protein [Chitinophagaceae bacterium]|nr:GPW/gp25 family protein [Chitinophagaceae bacterium]